MDLLADQASGNGRWQRRWPDAPVPLERLGKWLTHALGTERMHCTFGGRQQPGEGIACLLRTGVRRPSWNWRGEDSMPEDTKDEGGAGFFGRVWSRFGEVARTLGIVHEHDVNEALDHQETLTPRKKLGEILVERGKMTDDHVKAVLREQRSASVKAEAAELAAEASTSKKSGRKARATKKKAGKRANASGKPKKKAKKKKAKKKTKKKIGKK